MVSGLVLGQERIDSNFETEPGLDRELFSIIQCKTLNGITEKPVDE